MPVTLANTLKSIFCMVLQIKVVHMVLSMATPTKLQADEFLIELCLLKARTNS